MQSSVISPRAVTIYGNVTIAVLLVLLVLVWSRSLDPSLNTPILIIAAALIISRVALRMMARRGTSQGREEGPGSTQQK
jgi:hypothetical protein